VLRRTVARQISLQQACRMKGVDLTQFLKALERARRPREIADCAEPTQLVNLTLGEVEGTVAGAKRHAPPI
jgi:hypothetical protein